MVGIQPFSKQETLLRYCSINLTLFCSQTHSFLLGPALAPPVVRNSGKSVSNFTSALATTSKLEPSRTALS